jgi:hypothetical protein
MQKRKQPLTSILAHESVKDAKAAMYVKIIAGLEKLKVGGTFYEISKVSSLKTEQIWKRLSEMQGLGLIYNVGITRPGDSGRQCTVWQIVGKLTSKEAPIIPVKASKQPSNNNTVKQIGLF